MTLPAPGASQAIISNDKIRICHGRDQEKSKDIKIGMSKLQAVTALVPNRID